ncbi:MAG: SPFH domain-containing protein [Clostridia bacterium]|nr:SPFH domain-containing protein [Clostridia bacterium]
MGLIRAAIGAIGSTMHDQWKDVIACENMDNDTLMVRKTTDTGVITRTSIIRVMPGQCAIILQNGKVLDASAEEGDYYFDESTQPSFFAGNFGAVFKQMWQRFTYGGMTADQQAVYYFNMKEIMDNKFGTVAPIPYQDWSHPIPNQMTGGMLPLSVKVKCHGNYTFKIADPALFMKEIAGTASIYKKDQIIDQMRSEVISVFQNVVNELGTEKYKVPVLELPSQTDEIKDIMDEKIFDEPIRKRGLSIVVFAIMSVTLDEDSEEYIKKYNLSANANMQQGTLVEAYSEAVKGAANNSNGAANGFLGIGMMNMAGNGIFGGTLNNSSNQAAQNVQNVVASNGIPQNAGSWKCPKCGKINTGKFCDECGSKKVEAVTKKCPKCGSDVDESVKFCPECGEKLQ